MQKSTQNPHVNGTPGEQLNAAQAVASELAARLACEGTLTPAERFNAECDLKATLARIEAQL